jgi:16S rRNA (uracil1498-N3)-methyltransferase
MPRTHSRLHRLFVEAPIAPGAPVALDEAQVNYLGNVLRLNAGDSLVIFNGRDGAWLSRVERAGKKHITLQPDVQVAHQTAPADLWFGFAPLKIGRLDWMVERATEMGASAIQPIVTEYTQARTKPDKMRAWTIEAAQQCEVLTLPSLLPEIGLSAVIRDWRTTQGLRRLIFADESAPSSSPVDTIGWLEGLPTGVLIGPEGGFSDAERALLLAQDFVVPISLGPRILRADTAAVAALTLVQSIIGDWR